MVAEAGAEGVDRQAAQVQGGAALEGLGLLPEGPGQAQILQEVGAQAAPLQPAPERPIRAAAQLEGHLALGLGQPLALEAEFAAAIADPGLKLASAQAGQGRIAHHPIGNHGQGLKIQGALAAEVAPQGQGPPSLLEPQAEAIEGQAPGCPAVLAGAAGQGQQAAAAAEAHPFGQPAPVDPGDQFSGRRVAPGPQAELPGRAEGARPGFLQVQGAGAWVVHHQGQLGPELLQGAANPAVRRELSRQACPQKGCEPLQGVAA